MSKRIIDVGNVKCGDEKLFLISGPCVIEEESTMMTVAEKLVRISERTGIPVIYKSSFQKDNRSSVDFYQGPGSSSACRFWYVDHMQVLVIRRELWHNYG